VIARKGDLCAIELTTSYTMAATCKVERETVWRLGIVTSATRPGVVRTASYVAIAWLGRDVSAATPRASGPGVAREVYVDGPRRTVGLGQIVTHPAIGCPRDEILDAAKGLTFDDFAEVREFLARWKPRAGAQARCQA